MKYKIRILTGGLTWTSCETDNLTKLVNTAYFIGRMLPDKFQLLMVDEEDEERGA